jgi:hypothetical protein
VNNYHSAGDYGAADVINATNTWSKFVLFVQEGLSAGTLHHLHFNASLGMRVTFVDITTGDGLLEYVTCRLVRQPRLIDILCCRTAMRESIIEDTDNNVTYSASPAGGVGYSNALSGGPLTHGGTTTDM